MDAAFPRDDVHRALAVAARGAGRPALLRGSPTLAEHLRSRGYATGGVVANVRMCNQVYGVGRGFDTYIDYPWNQEVSFKTAMTNSKLGATVLSMVKRFGLPAPHHYPLVLPAAGARHHQRCSAVARRGSGAATRAAASGSQPPVLPVRQLDGRSWPLSAAAECGPAVSGPARSPKRRLAVPECGWRAAAARDDAPADERPGASKELEAVSSRLGDLYDDCLLGMDAELGRFLAACEQRRHAREYLGRHHGRPRRAFRRARPLRPWLELVQRDDSRAADSDSAAGPGRARVDDPAARCAAAASACRSPSATCHARSAGLLGPERQQPIPGPQPRALLERHAARRRRTPFSRSSKTRACAARAFEPRT